MHNLANVKRLAPAILALSMMVWSAPLLAQEKVDETHRLDADGTVDISNVSGSVTVTGWSKNEVHIKGTLGKGTKALEVDGDGRRLDIKVKIPKSSKDVEPTFLEIQVPRGAKVAISTVSADITVDDISGELKLQSVSGDIDAEGQPSRANVETVSGQLELLLQTAHARANSVSGDIELTGVGGDVEVETISGDITVKGDEFTHFDANSVSGDIAFAGGLTGKGTFRFNTNSGDVTLALPSGTDAEFDINTFSGDVENDFGPKAERKSKYAPGRELSFEVGSGDADVEINTLSGDVTLTKK
jgi:DUF4097 and DUF4098 domain-containing protein YvlB